MLVSRNFSGKNFIDLLNLGQIKICELLLRIMFKEENNLLMVYGINVFFHFRGGEKGHFNKIAGFIERFLSNHNNDFHFKVLQLKFLP